MEAKADIKEAGCGRKHIMLNSCNEEALYRSKLFVGVKQIAAWMRRIWTPSPVEQNTGTLTC